MPGTVRIIGPHPTDGAYPENTVLHATSVTFGRRTALICGSSGSGKSALALQLLAAGATLIADDMTPVTRRDDALIAAPPPTRRGEIEARGVGLLQVGYSAAAAVSAVINLDEIETERLPPFRTCSILGVQLPLFHKVESAHFPAAIHAYLKGERSA